MQFAWQNTTYLFAPVEQTKTQAFKAWFGKSRVVDESGKPLVVYRGEHGEVGGDFQSRFPSLSFGSREAANAYSMFPNNRTLDGDAKAPRVTPVYLRMENPLVENRDGDPFLDLSIVVEKLSSAFARAVALKHASLIEHTSNWDANFRGKYATVADLLTSEPDRLRDLYLLAYELLDDPAFVVAAKAAGYDGAIYGGSGETMRETEYRIFDSSQAKSAIGNSGAFDRNGTRILYWSI